MIRKIYNWLSDDFNMIKSIIVVGFTALVFIVLPLWVYQNYFLSLENWNDVLDNVEVVGVVSTLSGIFFLWFIFRGRIKHGKVKS